MGIYGKWANENSKYLMVDPGGSVDVEWTGEAIKAKNNFGSEGWEFEFKTDFGVKTMFISNGSIVRLFDDYVAGERLRISRTEKNNQGKSYISVEKI